MKLANLLCVVTILAFSSVTWANSDNAPSYLNANTNTVSVDTFPNWFNLDYQSDNVRGVSTERTYKELLAGKKGRKVIVAVIDSGVDVKHEDLKDVIWVNKGEIPDNGKDDDGNGYIDDINGWNFIGGKDGSHVDADTYELTRLYKHLNKKYKDVTMASLSRKEKKEFALYEKVKKAYEKDSGEMQKNYAQYKPLYDGYVAQSAVIAKHLGKDKISSADIKGLETDDSAVKEAVEFFNTWAQRGLTVEAFAGLKGYVDYLGDAVNHGYSLEFNPRTIVGDDYSNSKERYYGNNDVIGPDARHGTHVAGIIAASRGNGIGMDGVADNVEIMVLRTVPNGDERDKDVANAIRYAVDNGASIINMSFGKSFSWDKKVVDDAVKYATKKDVLLVHAAGNSSENTDIEDNYPNDAYAKRGWFSPKKSKTWMEIGALSWKPDQVAGFSNYGKGQVDLFAPGVDLNSTVPGSKYEDLSGTSMAAPVVAGVAAVLRSYFPTLTAAQIKTILMETTVKTGADYNKPGSKKDTLKMDEMCVTGGIINLYDATKKAQTTKGKKKVKDIRP